MIWHIIRFIYVAGTNSDNSWNCVFEMYDMSRISLLQFKISAYSDNGSYSVSLYMYRLESKYRYSGLLYDKLRCLLNYYYLNDNYFRIYLRLTETLSVCTKRFNTKNKYPSNFSLNGTIYNINSEIKKSYFIYY